MDQLATLAETLIESFVVLSQQLGAQSLEPNAAKVTETQLVTAVKNAIERTIEDATEDQELRTSLRSRLGEMSINPSLRREFLQAVCMMAIEDPQIIQASLLAALRLSEAYRATLARLLFSLQKRLRLLPGFKQGLEYTFQRAVITSLIARQANALALASAEIDKSPIDPTQTKNAAELHLGDTITLGDVGQNAVVAVGDNAVAQQHVHQHFYGASDASWNPAPYLRNLAADCNELRLSGLHVSEANPQVESLLKLDAVYISLDVESQVTSFKHEDGREPITPFEAKEVVLENRGQSRESIQTRRMTAIEAVCQPGSRLLVLLGEPGGGKSTFVRHLAFGLAQWILKRDDTSRLPGWTLGKILPVRILMRDVVAWLDQEEQVQRESHLRPTAETLFEFIRADLRQHSLQDEYSYLQYHLLTAGGLVMFDGLDEVPDYEKYRGFIKRLVESFVKDFPLCHCIVTCRPYAYQDKYRRWQLSGFAIQRLALFSPYQSEFFIQRWYEAVHFTEDLHMDDARTRATRLIHATRNQRHLSELAAYPLLLTLMATLHTALNTLPEDRAELYEQCIVLLLERWEKRRETSSITSGQPRVEEGIIKELNISRIQLEEVLQRLAFEMHLRQGRQRGRTLLEKAEISGAQLRSALDPLLDPERGADIFIRYIKNRAGLLADRGLDRYVFPHRTFQEFLAARHILNQDEAADELAQLARSDHIWWYEVFLLAVGYCRKTMDYARLLIDRLCSADYANGTITEEEAHASLLAAHAAVDLRLQTQVAKASTGRLVRRLQRWLVGILVHSAVPPLEQIEAGPYQPQAWLVDIIKSNVLPPIERAEVGRHLSQLGDMRPDVNCEIPWVIDISSGEFIMGSEYYYDERPQHNVILPNYRIGKYPVTNAQYHRFVDDGGYTKKHFDCWTQAGWSWLERDKIRQPGYWGNPQWTLDNHPVVGVSWYEAVAYCKWLSKTNTQGRVYRLPSEAEWEKAARGTDGREWPWGNKFDPIMANTVEGSVGRTTAVGIYPQGRSQFGVQDTAGNVWEWCSSRWGKDAVGLEFEYPYRADDGRENRDSEDNRIQRGGSWNDAASRAACADRDKLAPNSQHFDVGFRIAE